MKSLTILLVHNRYKIAGGEDSVVANEMKLLTDAGHTVIPYFRSNEELDSMGKLQKLLAARASIYSKLTYREVQSLIRQHHIDLVHVHNTQAVISPSVYYAAVDLGIPVIQTIHNFRFICPGALLLRDGQICTECISEGPQHATTYACYRDSKLQTMVAAKILTKHRKKGIYQKLHYIFLTDFNRQMLLRAEGVFPVASMYVKPNFAPHPTSCCPYTNRKKQLICISRLSSEKGVCELVEAWRLVEREGHDYDLLLCGDGPLKEELQEKIEASKLNRIHLMGQLPHEEVMTHLRDSAALVFPSKWYEGFPMVIAESFSYGTPVLCADIGNAGQLITEGITGEKYPPNNADALATRLLAWTQEDALVRHEAHSDNCRKTYDELYTPEQNLLQLERIYQSILDAQH